MQKTDYLFVVMGLGLRFTKSDISQVYQQLLLDERSKEYVAINAQRSLSLQNTPFWSVVSSGHFDEDVREPSARYSRGHWLFGWNLTEVWERLNSEELQLNKKKCLFLKAEVVYYLSITAISRGYWELKLLQDWLLSCNYPVSRK